jgi:hypothetical protein
MVAVLVLALRPWLTGDVASGPIASGLRCSAPRISVSAS